MVRNRYAGRTFIQPSAGLRHRGVTMKLNPLREVVSGKRLDRRRRFDRARDDDQADRRAAAQGRRRRGPRPDQRAADLQPVLLRHRYPDRDRADRRDAHAARDPRLHRGRFAGYLSIRGVLAALDLPYEQFCFACFDGHYPEPVPYDATSRKFLLEEAVIR